MHQADPSPGFLGCRASSLPQGRVCGSELPTSCGGQSSLVPDPTSCRSPKATRSLCPRTTLRPGEPCPHPGAR